MQKRGEDEVERAIGKNGVVKRFSIFYAARRFSLPSSSSYSLSCPSRIRSSSVLHHAAFLKTALLMTLLFAMPIFAQDGASDASQKAALIEQVVGKEDPSTGFITRASGLSDDISIGEEAAQEASWAAGSVVLMVLMVSFISLAGYLAGTYHKKMDARKGTFGHGHASRLRTIKAAGAITAGARRHVRSIQGFFSRRTTVSGRAGASVNKELESYLRRRQDGKGWLVSGKRSAKNSISSHEDEYWQRQKEQFWSRVRRADHVADEPRTIQQLAVKQVQQYNEAMAKIRQAKEDLYNSPSNIDGMDKASAPPCGDGIKHAPIDCPAAQQKSILNQLKEAHSI